MAWFTNPQLRDKLLEKSGDGVEVCVIIYKYGVNYTKCVDLSGLNHKEFRGERGGVLHYKFCVIDYVHTIQVLTIYSFFSIYLDIYYYNLA